MAKKQKIVGAADVLERLTPGMRIFVGTGGAEPKTLVRQLIESESPNLEDLELIQLVSFGNAISAESLDPRKYRLKTFFAGGIAASAITAGHVDLVPCRFSAIPRLFARRLFHVDVTCVQVTPPDPMGYCSLGTSIDVAFSGSCTNGRISDLREAARVAKTGQVKPTVRALVVPGSQEVAHQAEAEGLDEIFRAAGFQWREPGCSMCLAMNPDKLRGREVCASSSNRNFKGRQGSPSGRTLLMSPAMVAAAAIAGEVVDVRKIG